MSYRAASPRRAKTSRERRAMDAEMIGALAPRQRRVRYQRPRHFHLGQRLGAAQLRAAVAGRFQSSTSALTQDVGFQLGQDCEDVEGELPRGGRRVERLAEPVELDAALCQASDDRDEVAQGSAQPAELPDDHDVAGMGGGQEPLPFGKLTAASSRELLLEDPLAAGGTKSVTLQIKILILARAPSLADKQILLLGRVSRKGVRWSIFRRQVSRQVSAIALGRWVASHRRRRPLSQKCLVSRLTISLIDAKRRPSRVTATNFS